MNFQHPMARFVHLFVMSMCVASLAASHKAVAQDAVPDPWIEDAQALVQALRELHARVDWLTPRDVFEHKAAETLVQVAAARSDEARVAVLMSLVATVQDGHTAVASSSRYDELGWLPFSATWLDDGIFLTRVPDEHAETVGGQIVAVNDYPIELVMHRLRPFIPHSTESRFRRWATSYLHLPGLLYALGLSETALSSRLTVRLRDGRTITTAYTATTDDEAETIRFASVDELYPESLMRFRDPDRMYRLEVLPSDRTVYVGYRRIGVDEAESPWDFASRLIDTLATSKDLDRLIIDLRDNGGGGYQWAAHLGPMLAALPKINRPGHLFVLIGQRTFSATIDVANWLQLNTEAIFIGTPAGAPPVSPGDDDPFVLPNSGLRVNISRVYQNSTFLGDRREEFEPDIVVRETMADRLAGRDAAVEVTLDYQHAAVAGGTVDDRWMGRYSFEPDANLVVAQEQGRVIATVFPRLRLTLRQVGKRQFATRVQGLTLEFAEDGSSMVLGLPGGKTRLLNRLSSNVSSGWEHYNARRYEEAEATFRRVLQQNPDLPFLSDGALVNEAIHAIYRVRPEIGVDASRQVGGELVRMCIRLHPPGEAKDCEYSLRFYE